MFNRKSRRGFFFWSGDVNPLGYGGTWARKVGPRRWHFIQLTNMDDACGRDNEGRPTYVIELSEVDLNGISAATQESAWRSCDGDSQMPEGSTSTVEHAADGEFYRRDEVAADCCFNYGARAPLHSEETNNAHAGFRACRAESYSLTRDADAYRAAMERPVNRLGSTAAEYMAGDIQSALIRGMDAGDPSARIVGKMYAAAEGQTLGSKMPDGDLDAIKRRL